MQTQTNLWLERMSRLSIALVVVSTLLAPRSVLADVEYDSAIPQLQFAAQEIERAVAETQRKDLMVTLTVKSDNMSPEAFQIRLTDPNRVEVIGSDATGAMYGGIEVAEFLKLGLPIANVQRKPFVAKRGIKFNIPLDARSPSYDDSGDAANENIEHMWDFEGFWKPYLDDLARYRYNVLSLWTCHPYPHMVKTPGYEQAVEADVYKVRDGVLKHDSKGKFIARIFDPNDDEWEEGYLDSNQDGVVDTNDDTLELVKRMTIEEKIAHWKKVFQHAGDRGIQITLFHWNVFTYGATGKHGITTDQTDPDTIAYLRAAVKELVLNYPSITAIGVAAGENDNKFLKGDDSTEAYIFKTYGLGVMDAKADPRWDKNREVRFIFRNHSTKCDDVQEQFASKYDGPVDVSVKYCVGRLYSSRRPMEWESRANKGGWLDRGYKVWMNIRNDDIFMHRWGSPDYVRQFIREMPLDQSPGFMMGSDGYVWGRVFYSTIPDLQGQLEIDKHWYNFRLWGELAYNNELGDEYWTATLKHRFGLNDRSAKLLHDTWQTVSEVVPQLNRAVYEGTDASFAPEGCMTGLASATGFLTIPLYYYGEGPPVYRRKPMQLRKSPPGDEVQCVSVPDWGSAYLAGKLDQFGSDLLTPLQVADKLDAYADAVHAALPELQAETGDNVELRDLLWDLESMALLGRYYADKQRCAAKYWVYRESGFADEYKNLHDEAIVHIQDAQSHWEAYAAVLDKHYQPQLMSRTHYLDWNSTLNNGMEIQAAHFGVKRETKDITEKAYRKKQNTQKKKK